MSYEQLGYGGLGGVIGAVITFLGWNRRLNKLENDKVDMKFCDSLHKGVEQDFNDIKEHLHYIRERVDEIAKNGKK